jgi:hypothetical protein
MAARNPIPNGVFVNNLHAPSIRVKPDPPSGPSNSVPGGPGRVLGGPDYFATEAGAAITGPNCFATEADVAVTGSDCFVMEADTAVIASDCFVTEADTAVTASDCFAMETDAAVTLTRPQLLCDGDRCSGNRP